LVSDRLKPLLSSLSDEWETPWEVFRYFDNIYHYTIDVCASPANTKCRMFYTKEMNGLIREWDGVVWCNPPYTKNQGFIWVKKGIKELETNEKCRSISYLLPVRTDTRLWHNIILCSANIIYFIQGRIAFLRPDRQSPNPAPFPSCVVVFEKNKPGPPVYVSLKRSEYAVFGKTTYFRPCTRCSFYENRKCKINVKPDGEECKAFIAADPLKLRENPPKMLRM